MHEYLVRVANKGRIVSHLRDSSTVSYLRSDSRPARTSGRGRGRNAAARQFLGALADREAPGQQWPSRKIRPRDSRTFTGRSDISVVASAPCGGRGCRRAGPPPNSGARAAGGRFSDQTAVNRASPGLMPHLNHDPCIAGPPKNRAYIRARNLIKNRGSGSEASFCPTVERPASSGLENRF